MILKLDAAILSSPRGFITDEVLTASSLILFRKVMSQGFIHGLCPRQQGE